VASTEVDRLGGQEDLRAWRECQHVDRLAFTNAAT
jgi:hypothetical protein